MRLWIGDCHCQKGNHGSNISSSPTCISWAISCISWATCELHYRIVLSCSRHRLHIRHHSISLPLHHCYQGPLHRNSKISLDIYERQLKSSLSRGLSWEVLGGSMHREGTHPITIGNFISTPTEPNANLSMSILMKEVRTSYTNICHR